MNRTVKHFWAAFGTLAVVVGLYFAAVSVKAVTAFWLVAVAAAAYALGRTLGPLGLVIISRYRDHDRLLAAVASKDDEAKQLRANLDDAEQQLAAAYDRGIVEGRQQVEGMLLALNAAEPPEIVGIAEFEQSVALLVKRADPPLAEGARFSLEEAHTAKRKGVVAVVRDDPNFGVQYLRAVGTESPRFWEALAERVETDNAPPEGFVLRPYFYESPPPDRSEILIDDANLTPAASSSPESEEDHG